MMYLALSYDHRIVDGREAVQFLVKIKEYIEDPALMVLELRHYRPRTLRAAVPELRVRTLRERSRAKMDHRRCARSRARRSCTAWTDLRASRRRSDRAAGGSRTPATPGCRGPSALLTMLAGFEQRALYTSRNSGTCIALRISTFSSCRMLIGKSAPQNALSSSQAMNTCLVEFSRR